MLCSIFEIIIFQTDIGIIYILVQYISHECSFYMVLSLVLLFATITFISSFVVKVTEVCDKMRMTVSYI